MNYEDFKNEVKENILAYMPKRNFQKEKRTEKRQLIDN